MPFSTLAMAGLDRTRCGGEAPRSGPLHATIRPVVDASPMAAHARVGQLPLRLGSTDGQRPRRASPRSCPRVRRPASLALPFVHESAAHARDSLARPARPRTERSVLARPTSQRLAPMPCAARPCMADVPARSSVALARP
jgi:hypothetical protein